MRGESVVAREEEKDKRAAMGCVVGWGAAGLGWDANTGAIVARYSSKQQLALMCVTIEDTRRARR